MNRWMLFLCLLTCSLLTKAHQANISTTMLMERENGKWVLQIRASLTSFQYEVEHNYSDSSYNSPEQFRDLVIQHVKQHVLIRFNGQKGAIQLQKAEVALGHETMIVFELLDVPERIHSVDVKNSSFKDIHHNQSALLVLKNGFSKKQFVLSNANQHTVFLKAAKDQFVLSTTETPPSLPPLYAGVAMAAVVGIFYFRRRSNLLEN